MYCAIAFVSEITAPFEAVYASKTGAGRIATGEPVLMTLPPPALTSSGIPQILMPDIARLYLAGRLQLRELVTDTFPLEAIDEAFDRSRRADGLRPVLAISDGGAFP